MSDEAIAKAWPDRWAIANDPARRNRSKARNNLRRLWKHHVELEQFKSANPDARCANCEHRSVNQMVLSGTATCDLDSDFQGYQRVDDAAVCARWSAGQ